MKEETHNAFNGGSAIFGSVRTWYIQALKEDSCSNFRYRSRIGFALLLDVLHESKQSLTVSWSVYTTAAQPAMNCFHTTTAQRIVKSSSSKIIVLRWDFLIAATISSLILAEIKRAIVPAKSTSTAPIPAFTSDDSGSKQASVQSEMARWTTRGRYVSKRHR